MGRRAIATTYSQKSQIQYVFIEKLAPVEMLEEVYKKYFKGKNWGYMNVNEQVVCIGDIFYIAVY